VGARVVMPSALGLPLMYMLGLCWRRSDVPNERFLVPRGFRPTSCPVTSPDSSPPGWALAFAGSAVEGLGRRSYVFSRSSLPSSLVSNSSESL